MLWSDFLHTVWNYRNDPKPEDATNLIWYIAIENLLRRKETALPYAGVVAALCIHHPELAEEWQLNGSLKEIIIRAVHLSKHRKAREDALWAEYLMSRWVVLGTDGEAWNLLVACHYAPKAVKDAAQRCCNKVCMAMEGGRAMTDSKGNLVGKTQFEDLRLQMLRLAKEFRNMTVIDRQRPFENIPFSEWSEETQQALLAQQSYLKTLPAQALTV